MRKAIPFLSTLTLLFAAGCPTSKTQDCGAGSQLCGGTCAELISDNLNCGACGQACVAGEVCSAGSCQVSCQPGLVNCGGKCVDPLSDPRYCGVDATCSLNSTCAPGNVCNQGVCQLSCQAGLVNCAGKCIDPAWDRSFCGADGSCSGGAICAAGSVCNAGTCALSCPGARYGCGGKCIDPASDPNYCGAQADCTGGAVCGADQACGAGACVCPAGTLICGTACVDPLLDPQHCGATGDCAGANGGMACSGDETCSVGQCVARPDIDWRPASSLAPPHFVESPTTLVHIVFDGTNMVDSTGHTTWTKVGAPAVHAVGMWTPTQSYSGPFSSTAYWMTNVAGKTYLDANTAGDFIVCARYKPGHHPGWSSPNKIVIANGNPEGSGQGGWSLMQMHEAFCFHYHDSSPSGEWMAPFVPQADTETVFSQEWTWQCGGRDGTVLRELWESGSAEHMANGGQPMGPIGTFKPSSDLPTIGAYADGSSALFDGGVYEIIISSEPATTGNMFRTVARASGGIRAGNHAPAQVVGADGAVHAGAPSTVLVQPGGHILANQRIWVPDVLQHDPTSTGECYGLVASSLDWLTIGPSDAVLTWSLENASSQAFWEDAVHSQCVNASTSGDEMYYACGAPPSLAAGSRHTFLNCFDPSDRIMRMYADGSATPFATSATVPLTVFPRLDDPQSVFGPSTSSSSASLKIHRVFACSTADPTVCR